MQSCWFVGILIVKPLLLQTYSGMNTLELTPQVFNITLPTDAYLQLKNVACYTLHLYSLCNMSYVQFPGTKIQLQKLYFTD